MCLVDKSNKTKTILNCELHVLVCKQEVYYLCLKEDINNTLDDVNKQIWLYSPTDRTNAPDSA